MENIKLVKENHFIILNDKNRYDTRKPSYKRCIVDRIQLITRLERKIINKYVTDLLNNLPIESEVTSISLLEKILENQNIILSRLDKLESQMEHTPKIPNIDIPSFKPSNLSPQIHISKKIEPEDKLEQQIEPDCNEEHTPFNIPIETFRGTMKDIIDSMDMLKETINEKIEEKKLENLFNQDEMGYEPLMLNMDTSLDNSNKNSNVLLGINQIECTYEDNQPYADLFYKGKNIGYVENAQFDIDEINIDKIKKEENLYIREDGSWVAIEGRSIPIFFIHKDPSIFNLLGEYHIDFMKYPVYCEYNIKISRFIDYENIEHDYNPLIGLVPTSKKLITFI